MAVRIAQHRRVLTPGPVAGFEVGDGDAVLLGHLGDPPAELITIPVGQPNGFEPTDTSMERHPGSGLDRRVLIDRSPVDRGQHRIAADPAAQPALVVVGGEDPTLGWPSRFWRPDDRHPMPDVGQVPGRGAVCAVVGSEAECVGIELMAKSVVRPHRVDRLGHGLRIEQLSAEGVLAVDAVILEAPAIGRDQRTSMTVGLDDGDQTRGQRLIVERNHIDPGMANQPADLGS